MCTHVVECVSKFVIISVIISAAFKWALKRLHVRKSCWPCYEPKIHTNTHRCPVKLSIIRQAHSHTITQIKRHPRYVGLNDLGWVGARLLCWCALFSEMQGKEVGAEALEVIIGITFTHLTFKLKSVSLVTVRLCRKNFYTSSYIYLVLQATWENQKNCSNCISNVK